MKVHESQRKHAEISGKSLANKLFSSRFAPAVSVVGILAFGMLVLFLGCAAVR